MSQTSSFSKLAKIHDRQNTIKEIESELQCMMSCLEQGFTLEDYIESQKDLIAILKSLNNANINT
jgi:hypothetical protein